MKICPKCKIEKKLESLLSAAEYIKENQLSFSKQIEKLIPL